MQLRNILVCSAKRVTCCVGRMQRFLMLKWMVSLVTIMIEWIYIYAGTCGIIWSRVTDHNLCRITRRSRKRKHVHASTDRVSNRWSQCLSILCVGWSFFLLLVIFLLRTVVLLITSSPHVTRINPHEPASCVNAIAPAMSQFIGPNLLEARG